MLKHFGCVSKMAIFAFAILPLAASFLVACQSSKPNSERPSDLNRGVSETVVLGSQPVFNSKGQIISCTQFRVKGLPPGNDVSSQLRMTKGSAFSRSPCARGAVNDSCTSKLQFDQTKGLFVDTFFYRPAYDQQKAQEACNVSLQVWGRYWRTLAQRK